MNASLYRDHIQQQADLLKSDPSKFWKIVNRRRSTGGVPRLMQYNGITFTDTKSTTDLFAGFFSSVFADDDPLYQGVLGPSPGTFRNCTITRPDLVKSLRELDVGKGAGPDKIPNMLLKPLAEEFSEPLAILFDASLEAGIFPTQWKHSFVVPIFKAGNRSDCKCYRGIATLSAIPKLFEKIVCERLEHALGDLINSSQHGFRDGRSTCTNLSIFVSNVLSGMGKSGQVDAVYIDFAKAFDRVNHRLLLRKLNLCGVDGSLLSWIESYLSGRSQAVQINSTVSYSFETNSGVPQGSHLGPLLFAIFINDLCDVFQDSEFIMYADDVKIYRSIGSINDVHLLENDLARVEDWCRQNRMSLNVDKCEIITFSRRTQTNLVSYDYQIGDSYLRRVEQVKDLGV